MRYYFFSQKKKKCKILFQIHNVRTLNELNRPVSLLGSQYTYNVGFEFPTLGDSNLETQQYFYNL